MKYADNISHLNALKPDFMGFIFYPPSKRFVGLDFDKSVLNSVADETIKTAVFVNATPNEVVEFSHLYGMKAVQLHGAESPEFCATIKASGLTVIKAFGVSAGFDFEILKEFEPEVDYFLFDTQTPQYGGSGQIFDWTLLNSYTLNTPFFLSGGLSLDNLDEIEANAHPQLFALDLNSRFEIEPAIKDIKKLEQAFLMIR